MTRSSKIALAGATFLTVLLASTGIAGAHVTVNAPGATQGGTDQVITFRVPTESDTASTVGLKVQFPTDTPLADVLVEPIAGWTFKVTTVTLAKPIETDDGQVTQAVGEVDWIATAGGIKPGGFGEFNVITGLLPKTPTLTFKAIQDYSDKSVVSWVEVAGPGAAEPEHPAPELTLAAVATDPAGSSTTASTASNAGASSAGGSTAAASPTVTVTDASASKGASTGSVTVAIVLAVIGIVLGAGGLFFGLARRGRAG